MHVRINIPAWSAREIGAGAAALARLGRGTARRELVVATDTALFVAPDNGLLTPVFAHGGWRAFELSSPEFRLPRVSRTFHGRDVFAPAAAHLARGVAPERFGPPVDDPVRLSWPEVRAVGGAVAGAVLHVDRFGNLNTHWVDENGKRIRLPGSGGAADIATMAKRCIIIMNHEKRRLTPKVRCMKAAAASLKRVLPLSM